MTIIITKPETDIILTQDEYNQLLDEYNRTHMYYSGTPPTFETFVRRKKTESDPGRSVKPHRSGGGQWVGKVKSQ